MPESQIIVDADRSKVDNTPAVAKVRCSATPIHFESPSLKPPWNPAAAESGRRDGGAAMQAVVRSPSVRTGPMVRSRPFTGKPRPSAAIRPRRPGAAASVPMTPSAGALEPRAPNDQALEGAALAETALRRFKSDRPARPERQTLASGNTGRMGCENALRPSLSRHRSPIRWQSGGPEEMPLLHGPRTATRWVGSIQESCKRSTSYCSRSSCRCC